MDPRPTPTGKTSEALRLGVPLAPLTTLELGGTARFFVDAGADVTVYDGRPAGELESAIEALGGRAVTLRLGPEVDPAEAWASAELVATSPSINPDYPTTEPRLRER